MGAVLWVQVPLKGGHPNQSEAQLQKGDRLWEGSVEHKPWADVQEPDRRRCRAGRAGNEPQSFDDQGSVA